MTSVDNRIVHMTFDNKQFEEKLATTMGSMDKLKASLDFSAAKKGLNDVSTAASGFNLGGMSSAIENVSNKFIALSTVAITAIAQITSRAISAGLDMAKAFTFGPIQAGFAEMETNMNSIQTILANTSSKGSTLEDVNVALQTLNEYSDKTIYNFSQMARNIGTFTAAGVDLDTSVGAIKGIANLAAVSGSNAEQASSAMYQLSQALAAGSVKLIDWNSVVNAGMGGEVFKNALFETGKALGKLGDIPLDTTFKQWEAGGKTFRESLEDDWLTADVLTTTLQSFTGDLTQAQLVALGYTEAQAAEMEKLGKLATGAATEVKTLTQLLGTVKESIGSGWSKSFQIIIGDFNEAKALFTDLNNAISGFVGRQADARNELLQGWKDLGGRTLLIQALKDAFEGIASIIKPISEAFREIFPPATAERLFSLTQRFSELSKRLVISGVTADKLKEIFKGVFSGVKIVITIVKEIIGVFKDLFDRFARETSHVGVLDFFVNIAEKIQDLKKTLVDEGGIAAFFDKFMSFFEDPLPTIEGFIRDIKGAFNQIKTLFLTGDFVGGGPFEEDSPIIKGLFTFRDFISGFIDNIKGAFKELLNIFAFGDFTGEGPWEEDSPVVQGLFKFRDFISDIFESVKDTIGKFADMLGDIFGVDIKVPEGISEFFKSFGENVGDNTSNSLDFAGGLDRITTALGYVWDAIKKVWDVLTSLGEGIKWVWDQFDGFGAFLGDMFGSIFDFAKNIGPNLQKAFMSEEFDKFLEFLETVGVLLLGKGFHDIGSKGLKVDFTGGALTQLGDLFKDISKAMPDIEKNIKALTGVFKSMETQIKADALMKIAIAIGILTASVLVLSMIDPVALGKALGALAIGFGELIGSMALLTKMGAGPQGTAKLAALGVALIAISASVLVLAGAVAVMAAIDAEGMARGLAGVTALMVIMGTAAKVLGGSSVLLIAAGIGMVAIATSLVILSGAMLIFNTMSWAEIGKGMAAVAGGLLIIAGAMKLMPLKTAVMGEAMVKIAAALVILAGAMLLFNTMSWTEIGKGMVSMAGGLLIIAAAMNLMPVSMVLTGPALMAVAAAITILAGALKIMGSMSITEIGKALLILFGSLLVLNAALDGMVAALPGAIALGVAAGALLLLAKVLKEFGKIKLKELGMALLGIVAMLAVLTIAALALQPAIGALILLGIALTAIGLGFALFGVGASLVAEAFQIIAAAGTAGIDVVMYAIEQLLNKLPEMVVVLAQSLIDFAQVIIDALPPIVAKLGEVIVALLDVLIEAVPKMVQLGIALIQGLLEGIREIFPDIVKTGYDMLIALLDGIRDNIKEIVTIVVDIIGEFIDGVAENIDTIIDAGTALLVAFITGISDNIDDVIQAGVDLVVNLLEGVADGIEDIGEAVGNVIQAFIDAVVDLYGDIAEAGTDAIVEFLEGMGDNAEELAKAAGTFVTDFIDAIADEFVAVVDRTAQIVIDFLNDLADVIRENDDKIGDAFGNLGSAIMEGIIVGLTSMAGTFIDACIDIAKEALKEMAKPWEWFSPSHTMVRLGNDIIEGLIIGLNENSRGLNRTAFVVSENAVSSFQKAISDASLNMEKMTEFNPTITPVLDLTNVKATAGQLGGLLGDAKLGAQLSLDQARLLAMETARPGEETMEAKTPEAKEVKFEQNIYSPEALNTASIYRQTRNQIELAKKELEIV